MKLILSLVVFFPLFISGQDDRGYKIKGNITGAPDGDVLIIKAFNGDTLNRGLIKSGVFIIDEKGPFIGDAAMLVINKERVFKNLFIEPGIITISGDYADFNTIDASGTPSNDAWDEYLIEISPINKKIKKLKIALETETNPTTKKILIEEKQKLYDEFYNYRRNFAKKHNNTIIAPMFLSESIYSLDYKGISDLVGLLDPDTHENWYTNRLKERAVILSKIDYGKSAPDFTLKKPNGEAISISSLKGQVVLVDFWVSWCKQCRIEEKNLIPLYEKYKKKGFTILGVSIDEDREKWINAVEQDNLPWNQVSSLVGWECPVAKKYGMSYGITGVSYSILLDREGKVCGYNLRGNELNKKLIDVFGE
ncbi:MAG: TlpA disulfide reductase family protein [Bacteroidales bacterium]|jgi:peroxiredoxin